MLNTLYFSMSCWPMQSRFGNKLWKLEIQLLLLNYKGIFDQEQVVFPKYLVTIVLLMIFWQLLYIYNFTLPLCYATDVTYEMVGSVFRKCVDNSVVFNPNGSSHGYCADGCAAVTKCGDITVPPEHLDVNKVLMISAWSYSWLIFFGFICIDKIYGCWVLWHACCV